MPTLKVKLEFDVEITVNDTEDGLTDWEVYGEFKKYKDVIEDTINRVYKSATVESDLTVKFDE